MAAISFLKYLAEYKAVTRGIESAITNKNITRQSRSKKIGLRNKNIRPMQELVPTIMVSKESLVAGKNTLLTPENMINPACRLAKHVTKPTHPQSTFSVHRRITAFSSLGHSNSEKNNRIDKPPIITAETATTSLNNKFI